MLAGAIGGVFFQLFLASSKSSKMLSSAKRESPELIEKAETDAQVIRQNAEVETKENTILQLKELDQETRKRHSELQRLEDRLLKREEIFGERKVFRQT